jgi:hypothetical protein
MSDGNIANLQKGMQFLPRRVPIVVLWRVEEEFPAWREMMVSAVCRQKSSVIIFQGFVWSKEQNVF